MTYTIGQVAQMLGLPPSTLRYYESEGLLPALERTASGRRRFCERDLEACRVIECLKRSGLPIKDIKAFMDMVAEGDSTLRDRLDLFRERREAVRHELDAMRAVLAVLDFKTWYYEQAVAAGTEEAVRALQGDQVPAEHRAARARLSGVAVEDA